MYGIKLSNTEVGGFTDSAGELGYDANFFGTGEAGATNFIAVSG